MKLGITKSKSSCSFYVQRTIRKENGICSKIQAKYKMDYDLNDILSKLVYSRILYPSSKYATNKLAKNFIEQPTFELHNIYKALSVLASDSDYIQSELFKNSHILAI